MDLFGGLVVTVLEEGKRAATRRAVHVSSAGIVDAERNATSIPATYGFHNLCPRRCRELSPVVASSVLPKMVRAYNGLVPVAPRGLLGLLGSLL